MPMRADSMREAGEVEDGEIDSPTAGSSGSSMQQSDGHARSPPKLSIGLGSASGSRSIAGRAKAAFEDDVPSGSSSSTSASGYKIKGSAAPSSHTVASSLPAKPVLEASPSAGQGSMSIKGRSNGSGAPVATDDSTRHAEVRREGDSRSNSTPGDDSWPASRRNGMSIAGAASSKASEASNSATSGGSARKSMPLPFKSKTSMNLPFKPMGSSALPTGPASMRSSEISRSEHTSRGNSTETGYASSLPHQPARDSNGTHVRMDKGKSRETEDGEMDEDVDARSYRPSAHSHARSPERSHGGWHDHGASRHDDDRRYAGHGRASAADSSWRSPGYPYSASRGQDDRYHGSSRRDYAYDDYDRRDSARRHYEDDRYRPSRVQEEAARDESYRKRHRSRSRSRERDRDRHRGTHSRKDDSSWGRGSSYSPDGDSERRRDRHRESEKTFHDEPGAPRHPSRELAPKQSATNTPAAGHALLPKPTFIAEPRKAPDQPKVRPPQPPRPQIATPFFMPTPPPKAIAEIGEDVAGQEQDQEMEIDEASKVLSPSAGVPPVEAKTFTLFGTSRLNDYQLEEKLGEGTFGIVHKARRKPDSIKEVPAEEAARKAARSSRRGNKAVPCASKVKAGDIVALKKIVMHNDMDGVPITALREIRILKSLNHPNVVPVVDMAFQSGDFDDLRRGTIYMVFPYMAHDLAGLLENKSIDKLDTSVLKLYAKQLLEGTSYLHRNRILHRDMKAANLLISDEGVLQIADFGLARSIEDNRDDMKREYTNCVVTRWYRPPELLLGLKAYGRPIDMWGVGCVIGEMFFRHPVFTGSSDLDQLAKIVHMCGPINDDSMPGWSDMPDAKIVNFPLSTRNVHRNFMRFSEDVAGLLDQLLVLDPERRLTADEALDHEWFWTDPMPAEPGAVKIFPSSHEYDKRKAHEDRQGNGGERNRAAQEAAFRGPNQVVKVPAAVQQQPAMQQPIAPPGLPGPARFVAQPNMPQPSQGMRPPAWQGNAINIQLGNGMQHLQPNGLPQRPMQHSQAIPAVAAQHPALPPGLPARPATFTHSTLPRPPQAQPAHGLPPRPAPPSYGNGSDMLGEPDLKRRRMAEEPRQIAGAASRGPAERAADRVAAQSYGSVRRRPQPESDYPPAGDAEPMDY